MSLSEAQRRAAQRLGQDVCVVAGPGSGKTSVLINRFAWLVREQNISPTNILAITFTERAANEIKARLVKEFDREPALRESIERAYVSTIHGFCARLLREHAITAGLDPQFSVSEAQDSLRLLAQCTDAALESLFEARPETFRSLLRFFSGDIAASLMDLYEKVRLSGFNPDFVVFRDKPSYDPSELHRILNDIVQEPLGRMLPDKKQEHEKFIEWARTLLDSEPGGIEYMRALDMPKINKNRLTRGSTAHAERDRVTELCDAARGFALLQYFKAERDLLIEALVDMHRRYTEAKRSRSLLDFSDLEFYSLELLISDPALRDAVRRRFDFVLMDELQDTNPLQWKLVNQIRSPGAFFGVGDANQSIYEFRHANPALFHAYRESLIHEGRSIDELRENYRSRPEIITAVNNVFSQLPPGIDPHTLEAKLAYPSKAEPSVELVATFDGAKEAAELEASWVARRVAELAGTLWLTEPGKERVATFQDFAILARTNKALDEYQAELDRQGVPSILLGGVSFFDAREVRDIFAILRVLANPQDDYALAAVLRSPVVGVSDETLLRVRLAAGNKQPLVFGLVHLPNDIAPEENQRIETFWRALQQARESVGIVGPERAVRSLLDLSGYEEALTGRKRSNIEKLLVRIRARWPEANGSVHVLVKDLQASEPQPEAPPLEAANAVKLLTIHGAKGLEFPIVFLPGLHGRGKEQPDNLAYQPPDTLGANWIDPVRNKGAGDSFHLELKQAEKTFREAEDSRLLYVAMTRAREHLVMSSKAEGSARWLKLVVPGLGLSVGKNSTPTNVPFIQNGVRVLLTDQEPELVGIDAQIARPPLTYLPAPVSREPWDSTATVTSISQYEACPRKYVLSRFVRWPGESAVPKYGEEDDARVGASELGQQVHLLLAGEKVDGPEPLAIELADRFRRSKLGRAVGGATHVQREWDFLFAMDDIVLRGQIDLWFEHRGRITIVDYKTDNIAAPQSGDHSSYELQLQIYALALERFLKRPVDEAWLHFLRANVAIAVDLSPIALGAARETVARFKQAHADWKFPLRPSAQCFRCDHFQKLCPAQVARSSNSA